MRYILICFLFSFCIHQQMFAQNTNEPLVNENMHNTEKNVELTKADFETIVKFVLDQGQTRTYCNKYNNNPYFSINGFNIYLDPINQSISFIKNENLAERKVSDYDVIVIEDEKSTRRYREIQLKNDEVIIYDLASTAPYLEVIFETINENK